MLKSGVPWDVALNLPDEVRVAWCIAAGNLESPKDKKFDWSIMAFPEA